MKPYQREAIEINVTLRGTTTLIQSGDGNNGNE